MGMVAVAQAVHLVQAARLEAARASGKNRSRPRCGATGPRQNRSARRRCVGKPPRQFLVGLLDRPARRCPAGRTACSALNISSQRAEHGCPPLFAPPSRAMLPKSGTAAVGRQAQFLLQCELVGRLAARSLGGIGVWHGRICCGVPFLVIHAVEDAEQARPAACATGRPARSRIPRW